MSEINKKKRNRIIIYVLSIILSLLILILYNIQSIRAYLMADTVVSNYFTLQEPIPTVADITTADYGKYMEIGTEILTRSSGQISQTLEGGDRPSSDWRIFLKDDDGVWLILSDYMPKGKLPTGTGLTQYSTSSYYYSIKNTSSRTAFMNGLNHANWINLISGSDVDGITGVQVKGAFTLPQWIESWKGKDYPNINTNTNSNGYCIYLDGGSNTTTSLSLTGTAGYNDNLYFPHKSTLNNCYGYRLYSNSGSGANNIMYVGYTGSYQGRLAGAAYNSNYYGLRPALFLPNDVQLDMDGDVWRIYFPTVADITVADYGAYVDLGTSILDLNNISLGDNNETPLADWRVFSKDENGAWLILADYMPNASFDVTTVGLEVSPADYYGNDYSTYGVRIERNDIDIFFGGLAHNNWSNLITGSSIVGKTGVQVKGAVDLDTWVDSWNASYTSDTLYTRLIETADIDNNNFYTEGYAIGKSETEYGTQVKLSNPGYSNTLYFPHKSYFSKCQGYILSSKAAWKDGEYYLVYYQGWVEPSGPAANVNGVRPVVYLPNNIRLDTSGAVWTVAN